MRPQSKNGVSNVLQFSPGHARKSIEHRILIAWPINEPARGHQRKSRFPTGMSANPLPNADIDRCFYLYVGL